ncbi:MAG: hypothetical protein MI742_01610 [Desulfobacterales bacterium]|nr:hypothetical protein [Desulfobacterales bacterium]
MSPSPNYPALRLWLDAGQWVTTLLVGLYVWIANKAQATVNEVNRVKSGMGALENRIIKLETAIKTVPSHDDLAAVYERINDVAENVAELSGKMDGVQGSLGMIHDHLLNEKREPR